MDPSDHDDEPALKAVVVLLLFVIGFSVGTMAVYLLLQFAQGIAAGA